MVQYKVTWEIEVEADNQIQAAEMALETMRDMESEALYFEVTTLSTGDVEGIDLLPPGEEIELTEEELEELRRLFDEDL